VAACCARTAAGYAGDRVPQLLSARKPLRAEFSLALNRTLGCEVSPKFRDSRPTSAGRGSNSMSARTRVLVQRSRPAADCSPLFRKAYPLPARQLDRLQNHHHRPLPPAAARRKQSRWQQRCTQSQLSSSAPPYLPRNICIKMSTESCEIAAEKCQSSDQSSATPLLARAFIAESIRRLWTKGASSSERQAKDGASRSGQIARTA
jgi:hypothetical protein